MSIMQIRRFTVAVESNINLSEIFQGFDTKVWNAYILDDGVCFTYLSKDGEEGYPGKQSDYFPYSIG